MGSLHVCLRQLIATALMQNDAALRRQDALQRGCIVAAYDCGTTQAAALLAFADARLCGLYLTFGYLLFLHGCWFLLQPAMASV